MTAAGVLSFLGAPAASDGAVALAALLGIPVVAAFGLAFVRGVRAAVGLNAAASALTFGAALALVLAPPQAGRYLFVDAFNLLLVVLTTFIAFTTSLYSIAYVTGQTRAARWTPAFVRTYHGAYQALCFAMCLALVANNIGLMWVAIELATLTCVAMVGSDRSKSALEAAWRYFMLGSVGVAFALFGTILVYLAAQPVLGAGAEAMLGTNLVSHAGAFSPALLNVAFVFVILGYGVKVGVAPMHAWLPDAHAEGPTPITAVLSGLLLNVALHAVLRFKMMLGANADALQPGPLLATIGLVSLVYAAFMLYRRADIKRLFGYSSVEHMGLMVFAFGVGGPLANFAGLLHLVLHSFTKSAIYFVVGRIAQIKGSQKISEIHGLTEDYPALGWALAAGVTALAGLPPFGMFMSEFLIVGSGFAQSPLIAPPLVFGLLVGFGALMRHLARMAFGAGDGAGPRASGGGLGPIYLHLSIVLVAGVWSPPWFAAWLQRIAGMLG